MSVTFCRIRNLGSSEKNFLKIVRSFTTKTKITGYFNENQPEHRLSVDDALSIKEGKSTVLDKCTEDVSHIATYLKPTFNIAAYINKSPSLKELLKLGVDFYRIEKKCAPEAASYLTSLNFQNEIAPHIIFLYDLGLEITVIGNLITKNPFIFKEELDDLKCRINYLKYKKFSDEMITKIIRANPFWLSYSTPKIDEMLGYFQKQFSLTGNEVRSLTVQKPRLITYSREHIKINHFVLKEEMGFNQEEVKIILLNQPNVLMTHQDKLLKTFEYLHNTMKISLEDIAACPKILTCRPHRLKERYMFLKKLGRVQFDPTKPNYISLLAMVSGTDAHFATELGKSSVHAYNTFLKSL